MQRAQLELLIEMHDYLFLDMEEDDNEGYSSGIPVGDSFQTARLSCTLTDPAKSHLQGGMRDLDLLLNLVMEDWPHSTASGANAEARVTRDKIVPASIGIQKLMHHPSCEQ